MKLIDQQLQMGCEDRKENGYVVEEIHILDSIEKIVGKCFSQCHGLSRVTFGESSSLTLIGPRALSSSGLQETHISESITEVCFHDCWSVSRVTFGECSSFKSIAEGGK